MPEGGDPVEVVPYDQRWEESFALSERELRVALAPFVLDIEHIGSTAVPGLAAKPVIDIQVGVRTLDDSVEIVSAVESLGYEYVPDFEDELPDRRYFRRWVDGRRSHQVHLVERSNTEWWDRHLRFRDWLRAHHDDRDRYADLKLSLAAAHRNDRRAYTDAKSDFIRAIEDRSIAADAGGTRTGHDGAAIAVALVEPVRTRLRGPVLGCGDAWQLAEFYAWLLGWRVVDRSENVPGAWALVESASGDQKLEFQREEPFVPPVWPTVAGQQQMGMHLDIAVDNLGDGPDRRTRFGELLDDAVARGARVAGHQPQEDRVVVMLDPAGHPFCLFPGRD